MRRLLLGLTFVGLTACAEKLVGPEAQAAVRAHRNEVMTSSVLVFVNGTEVDTAYLSKLKADQVESIEVLKGKAAQAAYGERASQGVILIALKKGK